MSKTSSTIGPVPTYTAFAAPSDFPALDVGATSTTGNRQNKRRGGGGGGTATSSSKGGGKHWRVMQRPPVTSKEQKETTTSTATYVMSSQTDSLHLLEGPTTSGGPTSTGYHPTARAAAASGGTANNGRRNKNRVGPAPLVDELEPGIKNGNGTSSRPQAQQRTPPTTASSSSSREITNSGAAPGGPLQSQPRFDSAAEKSYLELQGQEENLIPGTTGDDMQRRPRNNRQNKPGRRDRMRMREERERQEQGQQLHQVPSTSTTSGIMFKEVPFSEEQEELRQRRQDEELIVLDGGGGSKRSNYTPRSKKLEQADAGLYNAFATSAMEERRVGSVGVENDKAGASALSARSRRRGELPKEPPAASSTPATSKQLHPRRGDDTDREVLDDLPVVPVNEIKETKNVDKDDSAPPLLASSPAGAKPKLRPKKKKPDEIDVQKEHLRRLAKFKTEFVKELRTEQFRKRQFLDRPLAEQQEDDQERDEADINYFEEKARVENYLQTLAKKQELQPNRKQAMNLAFRRIQQATEELFGDKATVELFGSVVNGCATNASDYDCGIRFVENEKTLKELLRAEDLSYATSGGRRVRAGNELSVAALRKIQKHMQKDEKCKRTTLIEGAKVPILQLEFFPKEEKFKPSCFDISITTKMWTYDNSRLLYLYLHLQPNRIIRHLAVLVKQYVKERNLGSAKESMLSSYSYLLLLIHYLQVLDYLPGLQDPSLICHSWDENYGGTAGTSKTTPEPVVYEHHYDEETGELRRTRSNPPPQLSKAGVHYGETYRFFDYERAWDEKNNPQIDDRLLSTTERVLAKGKKARPVNRTGADFVTEFHLQRVDKDGGPDLMTLFKGFLKYYAEVWRTGTSVLTKSMVSVKAVRIKDEFVHYYYDHGSRPRSGSGTAGGVAEPASAEGRAAATVDVSTAAVEEDGSGDLGKNGKAGGKILTKNGEDPASWDDEPPEVKEDLPQQENPDLFSSVSNIKTSNPGRKAADEEVEDQEEKQPAGLEDSATAAAADEMYRAKLMVQMRDPRELEKLLLNQPGLVNLEHVERDFCPKKSRQNDWYFMIEDPIQPDRFLGLNRDNHEWWTWMLGDDLRELSRKDLQLRHVEKIFGRKLEDIH
ncbi:unnamed protein product [Amoebophrya sp. A120]|nr:unnamed protein product [Amoebophrya sp. A120]|eukprot:GSA120T00018146001.1